MGKKNKRDFIKAFCKELERMMEKKEVREVPVADKATGKAKMGVALGKK